MKFSLTLLLPLALVVSACATSPQTKTPTQEEVSQSDALILQSVLCMQGSIKHLDDGITDATQIVLAAAQQCQADIVASAHAYASAHFTDEVSVNKSTSRLTSREQLLKTWTPTVLRLRASARPK